jgi:hypothetical protein
MALPQEEPLPLPVPINPAPLTRFTTARTWCEVHVVAFAANTDRSCEWHDWNESGLPW